VSCSCTSPLYLNPVRRMMVTFVLVRLVFIFFSLGVASVLFLLDWLFIKIVVVELCILDYHKVYILVSMLVSLMVELTCKRCKYSWTYGGKNKYYATCPYCLAKVPNTKYKKVKVKEE
jgi:uncharacterized SAM-binding protein YcdF (DUF218 family)